MSIDDFLNKTDLEKSLLVGYYGGGNFGDELLLEVLSIRMQQRGVRHVTIAYQNPATFDVHHRDYGYERVTLGDKRELLRAIRRSRSVIIGGGGLWGLDVNANIFLLSLLLFVSRWLLGKRVYLVGVGYYGSTSKLGHRAAWLAGKAATHIIARDAETAANFGRINHHVSQDRDIAWQLANHPQRLAKTIATTYRDDAAELERKLPVNGKTLFITIRRFKPHQRNSYNDQIVKILAANQSRHIIISLMEPLEVDPEGYDLLAEWKEQYPQVTIADFHYNPIALHLWLYKHHRQVAVIAPQFHVIIMALLASASFLPVAYDNKVQELLAQTGHKAIPISQLNDTTIQHFIDTFYKDNDRT